MRIATLILGLVFSLALMVQSCLRFNLDNAINQDAGGTAFYAGIVALFAAAMVMRYPLVAAISFVLASLMTFLATSAYPDVWFIVWVFAALCAMSFFAWWQRRKLTSS